MNKMKEIKIGKLTLNVGVGEPGEKLEKAFTIISRLTGVKPVKTKAKKRNSISKYKNDGWVPAVSIIPPPLF